MVETAPIFLSAWRESKELSIGELAEMTGFSVSVLETVERSAQAYTPEMIAKFASAFNIEIFRLFVHPAVQFDARPNVNGITVDALATLLQLYVPDAVANLREQDMLDQLTGNALPEKYWQVQAEKFVDLISFLQACREDQTMALRGLFAPLANDQDDDKNGDCD